jgi:D-sedoheptulose 7-phosphate isomerase
MSDDPAVGVVRDHLRLSAALKQEVAEKCLDAIVAAARTIAGALRAGGKLLLCGNGGSAADCSHVAGELVSRLSADYERPALPAIALTTDTSILTALSNDFGFEGVFARQVQALGRPGDVLLGISTSGTSPNIIRAVEAAREAQMHTVALTGSSGRLKDVVDIAIMVPSDSVQHIQEAHLSIEHILCYLVERAVFGGVAAAPPSRAASSHAPVRKDDTATGRSAGGDANR